MSYGCIHIHRGCINRINHSKCLKSEKYCLVVGVVSVTLETMFLWGMLLSTCFLVSAPKGTALEINP